MAVLDAFGVPVFFLARIAQIEVDAVLSEQHDYDSEITDNPLENGTPVSDNQVLLPILLDMECRITDATATPARLNFPGRANEVYREIVALQKKKETISVITGLTVYQNMLIKRIGIPRTGTDGNSIRFSMSFKELLVVGDDAATNRDLIAGNVQHTALPVSNNGEVSKVAF